MFVRFFLFVIFLLSVQLSFGQKTDYQIFVTTPGYTSIRNYSKATFPELKRDFHVMNGPVTIMDSLRSDSITQVRLQIGARKFLFYVSNDLPYIRLSFDRNRRRFSGLGCNFIEGGSECVIEADIDENGMIHRIVPLSDTLFQYSKVIIDQIYDKAVRGWQPATRNGVPCRSLVQMKFELKK